MSRRDRKRMQPRASDVLEARRLLAAPEILGNVGQILLSQFQPFGFHRTAATQLQGIRLRGPIKVDVTTGAAPSDPGQGIPVPPINSGLIKRSQFNGGGFRTVGIQLQDVRLGRGLTVTGSDNEETSLMAASLSSNAAATTLPALLNRGLISNSQFNDLGFGNVERNQDGAIIAREGRVGLQWRKTRVGGPVDVGLDDVIIQPGAKGAASGVASASSVASDGSDPGKTVLDLTTNIGQIRNAQFNDGGFGDIGMQWSQVAVRGRVGTSTNTLFIKPHQDNYGPITIADRVFGRRAAGAGVSSRARTQAAPPAAVATRAAAQDPAFRTTYTNSATNSGRIVGAQFNDGGFGDVGLQWKKVRVGGSVTAVHNSLTVQPENNGQKLITVRGLRFPTTPPASSQPPPGPSTVLPADPPAIVSDGDPVEQLLPKPTGPLSPFFATPFDGPGTVTLPHLGNLPLVNAASNSGLIRGGQFNARGFGDQGLQWQNVGVAGNVQLVHNSLSVHPEGSKLAGISVADVAYGPPVSAQVARHLAVLPYAVISPGPEPAGAVVGGRVLSPPNDRWLTNQQIAAASGTDVFLQWNGIVHRRGLVLVHNIIKITGVGPATGPITLSNIRFPFKVPPVGVLTTAADQPVVSVRAHPRAAAARAHPHEPVLRNSANNSGVLSHAQFSDGGFGDDGLQWRHVRVAGSVAVVHNTLAVDESADLPAGDVPGPLTISGVTFNSGALDGGLSRRHSQVLVSPPDVFQRVSSHRVNLGRALPQDPAVRNDATNSGILAGGQLAAGGANHTFLQWQDVKVGGRVRVIDNVLSISVLDRPTGPIIISDVTFA